MKNESIRKVINVEKHNYSPVWTFKQEDDGVLKLELFKGSIPLDLTGQTIKLGVIRANKTLVELEDQSCFKINNNELDITLKNNILSAAGIAECDLELIDKDGKMTTASFFININKKTIGSNSIQASNEISSLEKLKNDFKSDVEDMKEEYNSWKDTVLAENNVAKLQNEINGLGSQLDNIVRKVTCSSLGMTIDDLNKNNFTLLKNALSNNIIIVVDNLYNLNINSSIDLSCDLNIKGLDKTCGFNILSSSANMFNINNDNLDICMENIKFKSSIAFEIFNLKNDLIKIRKFEIQTCTFEGDIRLVNFQFNITTNPQIKRYGIEEFYFNNNIVKNTRRSFIIMNDMTHNLIEIKYNNVINFDNTFITLAISNDNAFSEQLINLKKNVIISHNNVNCLDDWWHEESSTLYLAFAVVESDNLLYEYNNVEGLKSRTRIATYDIYASSKDVIYHNNIWKNNICFVADVNNTLLKAKGNGGNRSYRNNRFIVEKSFIEKHGDLNDVKICFISSVTETIWDIQNNSFDLYCLCSQLSPFQIIDFSLKNNIFNIERWYDSALFIYNDGSKVDISDNKINIIGGDDFRLIQSNSTIDKADIFINGNDLTLGNCKRLFQKVKSTSFIMRNNIIKTFGDIPTRVLFYDCKLENSIIKNNTVITDNKIGFLPSDIVDLDEFSMRIKSTTLSNSGWSRLGFNSFPLSNKSSVTFLINMRVFNGLNITEGKTIIKLSKEDDKNYISYTKSDSTEQKREVLTVEGNNDRIKFDNAIGIDLQFINSVDNCYFFIPNSNINSTIIDIDIVSVY